MSRSRLPSSLPQLTKLFIDGQWVAPCRRETFEVLNPTTGELLQRVARGSAEDVDRAVGAASRAFLTWGKTKGHERAKYLRAMAAGVKKDSEALAQMETLDVGKTLPEAVWDVDDVVGCFEYYAGLAEKLDSRQNTAVDVENNEYACRLRYEPAGVAAAIIPWNYPLLMALWKLAPALAAGCTMVLKPSELTPLTALQLARIASEAGLPPGVFNVITGFGPEAGAPLVSHPGVHKVAFTGSVPTGQKIMGMAAIDIKNISLELGGKSPAIVFDSQHLARTVEWIMFGCFANNGQVCSSTSRLLVQRDIADELVAMLATETRRLRVGDPLDPAIKIGPLVSKGQQQKVLGYIQSAVDEGATIAAQVMPTEDQRNVGCFVPPTILTNVKEHMRVWREEIFGPVLSIMTFDTEDEAIRLANDSEYGLAGAVFSSDKDQLDRVSQALQVGIVWNNCSQPTFVQLPWGGFKRSGIGRELGPFGLDNYLEPKQVVVYVADQPLGYYDAPEGGDSKL